MGAYVSALFAQITASSKPNPPLLNEDEPQNVETEQDEKQSMELNYDSPSESERSVSLISSYKTSDTDDMDEVNDRDKLVGSLQSEDLLSPIAEEEKSDFVNKGLIHYQKVRDRWRQKT